MANHTHPWWHNTPPLTNVLLQWPATVQVCFTDTSQGHCIGEGHFSLRGTSTLRLKVKFSWPVLAEFVFAFGHGVRWLYFKIRGHYRFRSFSHPDPYCRRGGAGSGLLSTSRSPSPLTRLPCTAPSHPRGGAVMPIPSDMIVNSARAFIPIPDLSVTEKTGDCPRKLGTSGHRTTEGMPTMERCKH